MLPFPLSVLYNSTTPFDTKPCSVSYTGGFLRLVSVDSYFGFSTSSSDVFFASLNFTKTLLNKVSEFSFHNSKSTSVFSVAFRKDFLSSSSLLEPSS
ncbi:unnamed protein product [Arabidopsis lyrata]|nr:unnamed protein product [Arabidopsis lyrata]